MIARGVAILLPQYQPKMVGLWRSKTWLFGAVPPSSIVLSLVLEVLLDHMVGREEKGAAEFRLLFHINLVKAFLRVENNVLGNGRGID